MAQDQRSGPPAAKPRATSRNQYAISSYYQGWEFMALIVSSKVPNPAQQPKNDKKTKNLVQAAQSPELNLKKP